jgi:hypothetical protein
MKEKVRWNFRGLLNREGETFQRYYELTSKEACNYIESYHRVRSWSRHPFSVAIASCNRRKERKKLIPTLP